MRIGDVAGRTGVSVRALRYYEEQGLLSAERTASGQRQYSDSAIERVRLIQEFYAAGLPSRTILRLLPCVETGAVTPDIHDILVIERDRIMATMAELRLALARLNRVIEIASNPETDHGPTALDPVETESILGGARQIR